MILNRNSLKLHTIIPFLSLAVLVVSCKVGQNYHRPNFALPSQFQSTVSADTNSIAKIGWKEFFTDTTLQTLIEKGIAYNLDLQVAIKRMEIANQEVKAARLSGLPDLNLLATGQVNYFSENGAIGLSNTSGSDHTENYMAGAELSWDVNIWGKIRRQKEAALARYLGSYEAAKAVQTRLISDIVNGYYNLLMLDKQIEIVRRTLILNDSVLQITRLLKNAGDVTSLAVQQAESQELASALLIPQLEQDIALQENALQTLTGQFPGAIPRSNSLDAYEVTNNLTTGLPATILSLRPDVRASEMALVAANAQVGVSKANMYPALNITATGGVEAIKASNWFNVPNSLFGIATGTLVQPVFQRRMLRTQLQIAKIEREQAVATFKQSVVSAVGEVSSALMQIEKLSRQQRLAAQQVNTLHQAIGQAQFLFKSSLANYLEVITAQSNALQAELNLTSIQRQQLSAVANLYHSLGGGWK
jgi:NodT family efflux transporter outer membrane factor (OMF) lipoprotein